VFLGRAISPGQKNSGSQSLATCVVALVFANIPYALFHKIQTCLIITARHVTLVQAWMDNTTGM